MRGRGLSGDPESPGPSVSVRPTGRWGQVPLPALNADR